ncbi:hypothetical protein CYMTET_14097 [Cymbomonas tetramitiformis]|uniref:Uncharacterized protein n=1 Tax=Cymbomonas tetramitiformis TaxID=36881 RepID=A0AAE0GH16_9CHLO|nr:hypothetical protein CYMTET_14097 [Cymbomonas tetramitiformis]
MRISISEGRLRDSAGSDDALRDSWGRFEDSAGRGQRQQSTEDSALAPDWRHSARSEEIERLQATQRTPPGRGDSTDWSPVKMWNHWQVAGGRQAHLKVQVFGRDEMKVAREEDGAGRGTTEFKLGQVAEGEREMPPEGRCRGDATRKLEQEYATYW